MLTPFAVDKGLNQVISNPLHLLIPFLGKEIIWG